MLTKEQILSASEEEFMNEEQLAFIRELLFDMRQKLQAEEKTTATLEHQSSERSSDMVDQANQEEHWMVQIKVRSHESDLLSDIEKALYKVDSGNYGYCEYSGEPIDIRRLLARPTSRTTIEEQTRREKQQSLRVPD